MPKRRTDDVVHVVMTDHYIQRRKPARDLLAEKAEQPPDANPYHGEVVLYYPKTPPRPADELYLAVAQVQQGSNLSAGIERLAAAIEKYKPARPEYDQQLADAWLKNGRPERAVPIYEEVLRRQPDSVNARQSLALSLISTRQYTRAIEILKSSLDVGNGAATDWHLLGSAYVEQGKLAEAVDAFQKAAERDPEMPEAYNSLGGIWLQTRDTARAEPALRRAILLEPNYTQAHNNLANLLAASGRFEEARYHFDAALRIQPKNSGTHYNYAVVLARAGQRDAGQRQAEAAIASDPNSAEAHEFLGTLLAAKGDLAGAIARYREALRLRPDFPRALLHLGETLADSGDFVAAAPYLNKAAEAPDPVIRREAQDTLKSIQSRR